MSPFGSREQPNSFPSPPSSEVPLLLILWLLTPFLNQGFSPSWIWCHSNHLSVALLSGLQKGSLKAVLIFLIVTFEAFQNLPIPRMLSGVLQTKIFMKMPLTTKVTLFSVSPCQRGLPYPHPLVPRGRDSHSGQFTCTYVIWRWIHKKSSEINACK